MTSGRAVRSCFSRTYSSSGIACLSCGVWGVGCGFEDYGLGFIGCRGFMVCGVEPLGPVTLWGLSFGAWNLGSGILCFGFGVWGSGFRVWGFTSSWAP
jgi:hypothetical protein